MLDRRTFLASGVAAGAAVSLNLAASAEVQETPVPTPVPKPGPAPAPGAKRSFKLKYAPHFGMFEDLAGKDLIDQLKFIADQGFTALEDNGMMDRPKEEQEKIAREMSRLGLTMGVFVAYAEWSQPTMVHRKPEVRELLAKQMRSAVECAKRVNAKWCTVVPGPAEPRLSMEFQTANCVENLKACAALCEPAGLVMVLEPLNFRDHPALFLTRVPQAYQICKAVGSPSCKILDDLYHQQVSEGNLIPNLDAAWDEIAYFQLGDNPGRKEPTTGEVNFRNIFRHLHAKGYAGLLGMEHGTSGQGRAGEEALIAAYVACDTF